MEVWACNALRKNKKNNSSLQFNYFVLINTTQVRTVDSNENRGDVDNRYCKSEYSSGDNLLKQDAVKTSLGHVVIDLDAADVEIKKFIDIEEVINVFV